MLILLKVAPDDSALLDKYSQTESQQPQDISGIEEQKEKRLKRKKGAYKRKERLYTSLES